MDSLHAIRTLLISWQVQDSYYSSNLFLIRLLLWSLDEYSHCTSCLTNITLGTHNMFHITSLYNVMNCWVPIIRHKSERWTALRECRSFLIQNVYTYKFKFKCKVRYWNPGGLCVSCYGYQWWHELITIWTNYMCVKHWLFHIHYLHETTRSVSTYARVNCRKLDLHMSINPYNNQFIHYAHNCEYV